MPSAASLRKLELAILGVGLLIALVAIGIASKGSFQANMAWTHGTEKMLAFLFTVASLLLVGVIVAAPYVLLAFLGKFLARGSAVSPYQVAGFMVSTLSTVTTFFLYREAIDVVTGADATSTSALVLVVFPAFLLFISGAVYGAIIFMHSRLCGAAPNAKMQRKRSNQPMKPTAAKKVEV